MKWYEASRLCFGHHPILGGLLPFAVVSSEQGHLCLPCKGHGTRMDDTHIHHGPRRREVDVYIWSLAGVELGFNVARPAGFLHKATQNAHQQVMARSHRGLP